VPRPGPDAEVLLLFTMIEVIVLSKTRQPTFSTSFNSHLSGTIVLPIKKFLKKSPGCDRTTALALQEITIF
jgi:hypothetical protein